MIMLYDSKEVDDEFNPPPPKPEYLSTAQGDYYKEFTPSKPAPTATHDYKHDQPVTFWTEHRDRVTISVAKMLLFLLLKQEKLPNSFIPEDVGALQSTQGEVGVTQVKTHDTAFRKNDAFSQPINEYFNDPQPYEDEMVPKM